MVGDGGWSQRWRWFCVPAIALVLAVAALVFSLLQTKQYESTARVGLKPLVAGAPSVVAPTFNATELADAAALVQSHDAAQQVIVARSLREDAGQLARSVSLSTDAKRAFLTIKVRYPNAHDAQSVAQSYADAVVTALEPAAVQGGTDVVVVNSASFRADSVAPRTALNVALGFLLGVLVGVGLVIGRRYWLAPPPLPVVFAGLTLVVLASEVFVAPHSLTRATLLECLVAGAVGVPVVSTARRRGTRRLWWVLGLGAVVALLSAADAIWGPQHSLKAALPGFRLVLLLTVVAVAAAASTSEELRRNLRGLVWIANVATLMAVIEAATRTPLLHLSAFQLHPDPHVPFRPSALFGHPSVLAAFNTAVAVSCLSELWIRRQWSAPRFGWTVALPLLGALVSQTRSIYFVLPACLLLLVIRYPRTARQIGLKRIGVGALLLVVVVGAIALADSGLRNRFQSLTASEQGVRRDALSNAMDNTTGFATVVGNGPRSIQHAFDTLGSTLQLGTLDNQYLTAYADYGLVGLAVLLLCFAVVGRSVLMRRQTATAAALSLGTLTLFGLMFFFDVLYWPILCIVAGIGIGSSLQSPSASE